MYHVTYIWDAIKIDYSVQRVKRHRKKGVLKKIAYGRH